MPEKMDRGYGNPSLRARPPLPQPNPNISILGDNKVDVPIMVAYHN
jgi:hypothetical protein